MLGQRLDDGGLNCRANRSGARASSVHSTISVIDGLAEYLRDGYAYRAAEVREAIGAATGRCWRGTCTSAGRAAGRSVRSSPGSIIRRGGISACFADRCVPRRRDSVRRPARRRRGVLLRRQRSDARWSALPNIPARFNSRIRARASRTGGSPCARFACWPGPGHDRRAFPRPLATRCKYTTLGPGRRRHARHGGGQTASANAVLVFQPSVGSEDGVGSFAGVDGAVAALVGPVGDLAGEAGGFGGAAFVVGDSG